MATTVLEASRTKLASIPQLFASEHGSQIFVYTHLRTRQTVYSLAKIMTSDALKQLSFVGKKSVPATLRKDMWAPLCVLDFPNPYQGLHAYARLREFRERHETEWPLEEFTVTKGPHVGNLMSRRERSFKLMDQKANSIADMAAVLAIQARPPESWLVNKMAYLVDTKEWLIKKKGQEYTKKMSLWPRAKRGQNSKIGHKVFEFQGKIDGTTIWWANPLDAEYAETWPAEVVHHNLETVRGHARWPPLSAADAAQARTAIQDAENERKAKSEDELEVERIALLEEKIADARNRAIKVPRPIRRPRFSQGRTEVQDTKENSLSIEA